MTPHPSVRRRHRLRALVAAAVPLVLLLSACAPTQTPAPDDSGASSLESYYEQELALEPCETPGFDPTADAVVGECGHIEVPLDYENPQGDTAQIAVFRVPAQADDAVGSLFINPGGPGYPGIGYAADIARGWAGNPIGANFDIVGFDPRGTGATTPAIDCFTNDERDANAATASQLASPGVRPLVEACAESVGGTDALAHLGTRDVARDMDVMREVFGDEKLSYAGSSYGTRLGAVYAEMFPENVRALVLDGAMDPHTGTAERRIDQWTGMQRGFEQVAAFCIAQGDCVLGDDVDTAIASYQQLVRPLLETPVPTADGRELSFIAASDAVVSGLYSAASWPIVIAGITELAQGRGDTLMAMRDFYHGRSPDGSYTNDVEATLAIDCLDEDRFTPASLAEMTNSALAAAPFLDPGVAADEVPDLCENWPTEPTLGYPYATNIEGLPQTLTVSVTGDALTPHSGGISLAETLGGSLLTVEGEQHGTLLAGNDCVDAALADYLVDLETPAEGATCRL